jgi:hypothetical protein
MSYLETLKRQFNEHVSLREKRPGVMQLYAPLYHEDGDMVDIFIEKAPDADDQIRVSDHGLTLMRLSYSFELDTDNKRRILNRILAENGVENDDGNLYLDVTPDRLNSGVLQFAQTVAKVCNLDVLRREIVSGLFFDMVNEFVNDELQQFHPRQNVCPIPHRDDLEVDVAFDVRPSPVYLFLVNNAARARLATISCLEFQRTPTIRFKGCVLHEDFEALPNKDRTRITSAADKQFVSFDDFKRNALGYFEREMVRANGSNGANH